jgi:hypothetical protein
VQELQVTGITFTNIRTTELIVSWTAPTRYSYVIGYDVEWQSGGKVVGATSPQRVTSLTPGRTYEVKVISKDTGTEPGVTRTTYTSKQQAASKKSKYLLHVLSHYKGQGHLGLKLKKACPLNCLRMLWSTVFIFGIEVVYDL